MWNNKQIKWKIKIVSNLQKIMKAMEIVSTIKLQKSKENVQHFNDFMMTFLNVLQIVQNRIDIFNIDKRKRDSWWRRLLIVVTSDKWLCWSINSKLLKIVQQKYSHIKYKTDVIAIWKKWLEFFVRNWRNIVGNAHIKDSFSQDDLKWVFSFLKDAIENQKYAKIKVFFNYFKNTVVQIPTRFKVYPLDKESFDKFLFDINMKLENIKTTENKYLMIEPDKYNYQKNLVQILIESITYAAVLQNKAWEHASRMIAMKNAKDNCNSLNKALSIVYNKNRQAKITQEISEIVSAKIAIEWQSD